jgi:hypothetical protein
VSDRDDGNQDLTFSVEVELGRVNADGYHGDDRLYLFANSPDDCAARLTLDQVKRLRRALKRWCRAVEAAEKERLR